MVGSQSLLDLRLVKLKRNKNTLGVLNFVLRKLGFPIISNVLTLTKKKKKDNYLRFNFNL
jgi:hypothetical protein